ncbi:hypothetical protein SSX86_003797 [Deinandra increscens subsp. villosa]|uniref:Protein NUCLEAR FUSION DEFECTIVE 6, chloroplastic/mitochondrial-like n=1 Tax=Deinandra increscens subsp. villosa TaxID=3103831 RepID=A0AAP0DQV6_9ASTR
MVTRQLQFTSARSNLQQRIIKMTGAAARSFLRSSSVRKAAARVFSEPKCKAGPSPSPFGFTTTKPPSHRIFRCPVEMSACVETMQPFHTATASALMTSMLTISRTGYGWLPQGSVGFGILGHALAIMTCEEGLEQTFK